AQGPRARRAAPSLHGRAGRFDPAPRRAGPTAQSDPWHDARPRAPAPRLPVPSALHARAAARLPGPARAGGGRAGPPGRLPLRTGAAGMSAVPLIDVRGITKQFPLRRGLVERLRGGRPPAVHALRDVNFSVVRGETKTKVCDS